MTAPPLRTFLERAGAVVRAIVVESERLPPVASVAHSFGHGDAITPDAAGAHLADGTPIHVSVGAPYDGSRWVEVELARVDAWLRATMSALGPGTRVWITTAGDRQLSLVNAEGAWRLTASQGLLARAAVQRQKLCALWEESCPREARRVIARLPPSVTATSADAPPGWSATSILEQTYGGAWSAMWTRRLAHVRSGPVRAAWIADALRTLGGARMLWLLPDQGSIAAGQGLWWRIDVHGGAEWLDALFDPGPPDYVVVVAPETDRMIAFTAVSGVPFLHLVALSRDELLALRASSARLDELLATIAPVERTSLAWRDRPITEAEALAGSPLSTLPRDAPDARQHAWIRDLMRRPSRTAHDSLSLSLGGPVAMPWVGVNDDADASGIAALWTRSGVERLFVLHEDRTLISLARTGEKLEAFVRVISA